MKKFCIILFSILCLFINVEAQRVLNDDERQQLVAHTLFTQKCQWAIRDYASYWNGHDGTGLSTNERLKWRREYAHVSSIVRADYTDPNLTLRFLILAKGMTFAVDADPTSEEIIALFVSGNKFEELASLYFDMVAQ